MLKYLFLIKLFTKVINMPLQIMKRNTFRQFNPYYYDKFSFTFSV